jgi:hypothetical protein
MHNLAASLVSLARSGVKTKSGCFRCDFHRTRAETEVQAVQGVMHDGFFCPPVSIPANGSSRVVWSDQNLLNRMTPNLERSLMHRSYSRTFSTWSICIQLVDKVGSSITHSHFLCDCRAWSQLVVKADNQDTA